MRLYIGDLIIRS